MKRGKHLYRLLVLALMLSGRCHMQAQYIPIKDAFLAKAMCSQCYYVLDNNCQRIDTVKAAAWKINTLTFSNLGVKTAEEVVHFKQVGTINGQANQLVSFPKVNSTIQWNSLDLSDNKLKEMPDLAPLSKTLTSLYLQNNELPAISGLERLVNLKILNLSNNFLRSLPSPALLPALEKLDVSHNYLSFTHLLPLVNYGYANRDMFITGNQKILTKDTVLHFFELEQAKLTIAIDTGLTGLTYTWYKDNKFLQTTSRYVLPLSRIQKKDSGTYYAIVTSDHPSLKNTALSSGQIKVIVSSCQEIEKFAFSTTINCDKITGLLRSAILQNTTHSFQFVLENTLTSEKTEIVLQQPFFAEYGSYHLLAEDNRGCVSRKLNALVVQKPENCPVVFSPNGDGQQDVYLVNGTGEAAVVSKDGVTCKTLHLPAYWDGTDQSGNPVPLGSYLILKKDGSSEKVTVLR